MTKKEAIDAGKKICLFSYKSARVQVMGGPTDGEWEWQDGRLCIEPDRGQLVIYHVGARQVWVAGRWESICTSCGLITWEPRRPQVH